MRRSSLPENLNLDLPNGPVSIALRRNDRARRFILRHGVDGSLAMTIPPGGTFHQAQRFAEEHKGWLQSQLAAAPDRQPFSAGERIPFQGVDHVIIHSPERRGTVHVAEFEGEPALLVAGGEAHLPRRLTDWLKKQARSEVTERVAHHTRMLNVTAKRIRIGDPVSRWGSCSSKGSLSFSWRVVMAPPDVLDYLVAHEVAHLREMNHSPRFWALVEKTCPDFKASRHWLRINGSRLHAIGGA